MNPSSHIKRGVLVQAGDGQAAVHLVRITPDGEETQCVTMIRSRDLLVRDAAGRYFNVRYQDLRSENAR